MKQVLAGLVGAGKGAAAHGHRLTAGVDFCVRIIAGSLKGRRLDAPTWAGLRPTSDKLRETLFNVLQGRLPGARVLDAYAGTGAVGVEALSRGAVQVTFVERDPRARALIAANLSRCGVSGGYTIERGSVEDVLSRLEPDYDVVFLDPPYDEADLGPAVTLGVGSLAADGICVLEHAARREPPPIHGTGPVRRLTSGDSALAFYVR